LGLLATTRLQTIDRLWRTLSPLWRVLQARKKTSVSTIWTIDIAKAGTVFLTLFMP